MPCFHERFRATRVKQLDPTGPPEDLKESFVSFLEEIKELYDSARTEVEEAGVPDVEGGEEFAQELSDVFQQGSNELENSIEEAQALPTDSPEEFAAAAQELGTGLQDVGTELAADFDDIETPDELQEAFEDEEGCPTGS